jgi:hypothetical protein
VFPRSLLVALAILGAVLGVTAIEAPFTIDENNHLVSVVALRSGGLTLPQTAALPPSRELLFFDPTGSRRAVEETPVSSTVPPLYAPLAVAFSLLGWRGLVALNTLCWAGTGLLIFACVRRYTDDAAAPWLGAGAFTLASYSIEYAQGVWPHMLSVFLCTAAVVLGLRALDEHDGWSAAGAGLSVALATGVRYQNAFFAACLGLGLLLLAQRRIRSSALFAVGAAPPTMLASWLNFERFGYWNPISKGRGYLPTPGGGGAEDASSLAEVTVDMAWARVVDYSARPQLVGSSHASFLFPDPESGAFVLFGAVKKAWLQSSPWILVALVVLLLVWLPAGRSRLALGAPMQRALRFVSLPVVLNVGMFSATGIYRTDGLCFNQRYFHEMVPLLAIALACAYAGLLRPGRVFVVGASAGALLAGVIVWPLEAESVVRQILLLRVPLAFALATLAVWWLARRRTEIALPATALLGASLAWALVVHVGDDLVASRLLRGSRWEYFQRLSPFLADGSAVFATGGVKDALGPALLDRDIVVLNPALDDADTARDLVVELLGAGRRVFIARDAFTEEQLRQTLVGLEVRPVGDPIVLMEVVDPGVPA